jgi:hypothetical protein
MIKKVEPTPILATTEVRMETTTEMATQTVTVQKLQTVTVCETETVTDRKTQSIVMCKIETVTEKKTQTTTVEIPRSTTLHPAPTSTPYFHKGPGKIAAAAEQETLSQEINNMSESIDISTSTSEVEDDEEKDQPAPTAAFRSQNGPGKIVNGTTPETTQ